MPSFNDSVPVFLMVFLPLTCITSFVQGAVNDEPLLELSVSEYTQLLYKTALGNLLGQMARKLCEDLDTDVSCSELLECVAQSTTVQSRSACLVKGYNLRDSSKLARWSRFMRSSTQIRNGSRRKRFTDAINVPGQLTEMFRDLRNASRYGARGRQLQERLHTIINDETVQHTIEQQSDLRFLGKPRAAKIQSSEAHILSPQFFSIAESDTSKSSTDVLSKISSPDLLDFHSDGELSTNRLLSWLPESTRKGWIEFLMEITGATETLEKVVPPLDSLYNDNTVKLEREIRKTWSKLTDSLNNRQMTELERFGYTLADSFQLETAYSVDNQSNEKLRNISNQELQNYANMTLEERQRAIESEIRLLASNGSVSSWHRRQKQRVFALSTSIFRLTNLSPSVLNAFIVRPSLFTPVLLSPSAISALILTPTVGSPVILSPSVLQARILNPNVLTPIILSPGILSTQILQPTALSPIILSPRALQPHILSPGAVTTIFMSPRVLSPDFFSRSVVNAVIMSPAFLS